MPICLRCQGELKLFEKFWEDITLNNGLQVSSITTEATCSVYICLDCAAYHIACENCSTKENIIFQQFIECEGFDEVEKERPQDRFLCIREQEDDPNNVVKIWNFESKNLYCMRTNDPYMPDTGFTGPDGGYYHTWRCNQCGTENDLTDK